MAYSWNVQNVATLKAKKTDSKTLSMPGVNSSNSAGTPAQFADATNRLIGIVGEQIILPGMSRVLTQEAINDE